MALDKLMNAPARMRYSLVFQGKRKNFQGELD